MVRLVTFPILALAGCLLASSAAAQGAAEPPVARLLPDLSLVGARIFGPSVDGGGDHSEHFLPTAQSLAALGSLNRALALQVGSFPLGPTATSVVFGSEPGADRPPSFGSGYVAGARTIGRGRRALAITYQGTTYDEYDRLDIRGSDINLFFEHTCCSGDPSERDLLQQTLSLRLHRKVVGFVFDYGLTDWFDVGVIVPFVEVAADARVSSRIHRTATADDPDLHAFDEIGLGSRVFPSARQDPPDPGVGATGSSTARGFGDVVLRGKLRLLQGGGHALAAGLDLQVPTGDSDEFIGLGATRVTPALMWSMEAGRYRARVHVSYTRSEGDLSSLLAAPGADLGVPDEIGYAVGSDFDVNRHITFVVDVVGRQLRGAGSFHRADVAFPDRGPGPLPSADFVAVDALQDGGRRTADVVLGSVGGRFYLGGAIHANVRALLPVRHVGLRPAPSIVIALDYGF